MLPNYVSSVNYMAKNYRHFPWSNKLAYAEYLAQTYYYVSHSTRLLAAAAARFSQADQAFHRRFLKHTDEENSHELLALRDLQKLGYKLEDFPELPQTRTFYEIQYYKIEHCDPAALLGYILALETLAGRELQETKSKLLDFYGKDCVKFIQVHADEDPDHIQKALEVVDALSPERHSVIDQNMEQTAICFVALLKAAEERAIQRKLVRAA